MPVTELNQEKGQKRESEIQRQIDFAFGVFQGDYTVRTILGSLAEGIVVIDSSGTILFINGQIEGIFGYQKQDLVGQPLSMLIPERFRPVHEKDVEYFFKNPRIRPIGDLPDLVGLHHNGSEIQLEIGLSFLDTLNGRLGLAFVVDITKRKLEEEALRFSEARYQALHRDNPTMITTVDTDLRMLLVNPSCARQLGYTVEELEGQSVLKLFHEDDRQAVAEQLRMCLQNPEEVYHWQLRKNSKDGSLVWVEEIAQAVPDLYGGLNVLVVCQDITARKRAEELFRESETFKQAILDSLPAHIAVLDQEGIIISVNRSWVRFAEENDVSDPQSVCTGADYLAVCRKAADMSDPLALEALEGIEGVLAGKLPAFRLNYPCHSPALHRWFMMNVVRPNYGQNGAVVTHLDITDQVKAEKEIQAANRELEAFNYTVAHDLRKPLTVVNGYCQALRELCSDKLDKQCQDYLQEAYDGTWRMNRLIDTLLNFSSLIRIELHREPVDLDMLAEEVVKELKRAEPERRVNFIFCKGLKANVDRALMQIVLANLIGNAWKYTITREEAIIEFGSTQREGKQAYFIRDNGIGFDPAEAGKLFIPFQRLEGIKEVGGLGIGLATVDRVIKRHGGELWAEGEPGRGATFYFTLGQS